MQSILKIFQDLNEFISSNSDGFNIASLPKIKNHKIGVSSDGIPVFFIKCEDGGKERMLDYNLEFISVQFNRECQLLSKDKIIAKGSYTVISLKTESIELQEYFLEIVFLVVQKLSPIATLNELKIEVKKLINLFNKFTRPPTKTIQGLWAELLVIEQSKNPEYLIKSWHCSPTDKFDFNDGIDKIEVKSTAKSRRVHNFSFEQLEPNKNSNLIIASVFAVETGIGKNIFDLVKLIDLKVNSRDLLSHINEVLVETLGKDFEKTFEIFFDYQLAVDSLAFFECEVVPKIENKNIRQEISNIHFDVDLSNIEQLVEIRTKSILHKSLIK